MTQLTAEQIQEGKRLLAEYERIANDWKDAGYGEIPDALGQANRNAKNWLWTHRDALIAAAEAQRWRPIETAWLMEQSTPAGSLYAYQDSNGFVQWSCDPNKAIRFARRVDAEMFGGECLLNWEATEHIWHTLPPAPEEQGR
jgi:hypothetical protein